MTERPFTVVHVVGARPNFMKISPVLRAFEADRGWRNVLVHTGQHYDDAMSSAFFDDLAIPRPDHDLDVGSGSHAQQTAAVISRLEPVLDEVAPDLVVVVGDVNSTVAAALCAAKKDIAVAHVEAGLRSRDRAMPEELNRIVTDQLSALCLTPSRDGNENLRAEGIGEDRIHFVGNVMIDTLMRLRPRASEMSAHEKHGLAAGNYALVTLHRPSNVDHADQLAEIMSALDEIARDRPVVCPLHPRTAQSLERFGLAFESVRVIDPVGYVEMLSLMGDAGVVLTDSGGIQEETTVLGVPCITLRSTTERPITISEGSNLLVPSRSRPEILEAFDSQWGRDVEGRVPEGWDGQAAERIATVVDSWRDA